LGRWDWDLPGKCRFRAILTAVPRSGTLSCLGGEKCSHCGMPCMSGLKKCPACFAAGINVWICDAQCQKKGWKQHKLNCVCKRKDLRERFLGEEEGKDL